MAEPALRVATGPTIREALHERGLRWTPQRRTLIEVLSQSDGHVTGAELVERCREIDPATIPSTVYRTLDVLEELGLLSHSHGVDGREEFHVLPVIEHGHLQCRAAGAAGRCRLPRWRSLVASLERRRGFSVDVTHLSILAAVRDVSGRAATDPSGVGRDAEHVEAAVDVDHLAGHRARQVGGEVERGLADVLDRDVRAQRRRPRRTTRTAS